MTSGNKNIETRRVTRGRERRHLFPLAIIIAMLEETQASIELLSGDALVFKLANAVAIVGWLFLVLILSF
jgi:hypothetical protein